MGAFDPAFDSAVDAKHRRSQAAVSSALRRRMQRRLFADLADVCEERGIREPGGFLAEIMAGTDPRTTISRIGQILHSIRARGPGEMPTEEEWAELADELMRSPLVAAEPVPLAISQRSAEKLLPYLYAPCKEAVEDDADTSAPHTISPLTEDEIEQFAAYWDEQY